MPVRRSLCVSIALALSTIAGLAHADADDIVFLKNGGRMRGVVMLEDPKQGVKIKLGDGSVQQIAPGDVDHIEYGKPAPPPVAPLPAGPAPPRRPLPAAASRSPAPVVPPGAVGGPPAPVAAPPAPAVSAPEPEPPPASEAPHRLHLGVAVEPGGMFLLAGGYAYVGTGAAFVAAFDLTPAVALRATAFTGILGGESALIPIGGSLGVDVVPAPHLVVGARGGVMLFDGANANTPVPMFGADLCPIGLRFGANDHLELRLVARVEILFPPTATGFAISNPPEGALETLVSAGYRFR